MERMATSLSESKIIREWSDRPPYCPQVRIDIEDVFSVTEGKVIYIGQDPDDSTYSVNIQVNLNEIIRYSHLETYSVSPYTKVSLKEKIGTARDYLIFEYCTSYQGESEFPVRINRGTYWKQDPSDIAEGKYTPTPVQEVTLNATDGNYAPELSDYSKTVF